MLIDGSMAFTLVAAVVSFTMLYGYLVLERFQLAQLEEGREARELERAIAERVRAETGRGGAGMSHNWSFVIAGYSITAVALGGYFVWIKQRTRRLRRTLRDENRD